MSRYIEHLGQAISDALATVPTAQPSQVAGYWANREFWLGEFFHLLDVVEDFSERLNRMVIAQNEFLRREGRQHNKDEFGNPRQEVRDTTNDSSRRFAASNARTALKNLADRALDIGISKPDQYETFVSKLRIQGRPSAER